MSYTNKADYVKLVVDSDYELPVFPADSIIFDKKAGVWLISNGEAWKPLILKDISVEGDISAGGSISIGKNTDNNSSIQFNWAGEGAPYSGETLFFNNLDSKFYFEIGGTVYEIYHEGNPQPAPPLTADDINAVIPSGIAFVYTGDINDIPSDWAVADGTGGTPNLGRRRGHPFIVKL
jgi:hypothetical protein